MKRWKTWQIGLFAVACVLLNYYGNELTSRLNLPLWLDSFGTVLSAYVGGPVCGSLVGVTSNLLYAIAYRGTWLYVFTSIALAVVVGLSARRKALKSVFGTMTVSAIAAIVAILVSVPLDILFHSGSTGNAWGDGIAMFLQERGCAEMPSVVIGQFYLEFVDKLLTLLLLMLLLWIVDKLRNRSKKEGSQDTDTAAKALSLVLMLLVLSGTTGNTTARAEAAPETPDYSGYVQNVYASNNGLPCGEANDIEQTRDGILWIGTYAGLYRYNGQDFRWMNEYESVHNVNCLYVDEEDRLWIGTNDNGLSILINERIANVIDQSGGLPSNSVRSIVRSSDGYYYIGTTGSMQILTLNSGLKITNTLWEINYADKSAADEKGNVAAITSDGRLFLLNRGRILSSLRVTEGEEIYNCCCFNAQGLLLVGTSGGHIKTFDISKGSFELVEEHTAEGLGQINDLRYFEKDVLFIAADDGVAYVDKAGTYHLVNTNEFNNSIDNVLEDYQGNMWFTSSRLGLLRMAPSAFEDVYSSVGMKGQVVNAVTRWQGNYYFATDEGLDVVDSACRNQLHDDLTEQLEGVRIRCALVDTQDHLWLCTYGKGLWEVEKDGTQYFYNRDNGGFGNRARTVIELKDGTIVAAGDTGISFIRDHEIQRTISYSDGLINSMILTLTEMTDGKLLAGTDGDGIAVIESGEVTRMLTRADGLSSEVILRTVFDERDAGVFIVTSNGLCYMDVAGEVRTLGNFPYFNNYDIWIKDQKELYVMSSAGLYVMNRDELLSGVENPTYELLDARRGLNSALTANSWTYFNEEEKRLFLSCDNGVFVIDVEHYAAGSQSYRMMISSIQLDGVAQKLGRGGTIEMDRSVSRIELFPEVLNYTIEDPYVGYWLEGFDSQWTITPQSGLSSIVYTNLPTGDYTLHLAVFDNTQTNVLEERSYALTKPKALQDNQWFVLYVALVPMLAVAWLTWIDMRRQMQRKLEKQEHELAIVRHQVQMGNETILAIAKAVDAKDERTSQHSQRVSEYSVMIAHELGFSDAECENLRKAALMHDIGKIGIPDSILNKPARLADDEYAIMKSHVTRGAEILKDFTLIDHVVEGALHHHERYDGRGYPSGMKGEEIPLYGRIIGVADAFDAMTANRVYRRQMDFSYVLGEMERGRGSQFDPQCVDILLKLINEGKIDLNALYPARPEASPPAQDANKGGEQA